MDELVIPSDQLARALRKALGVCNTCRPKVEYFEEVAKAAPEIEPQVNEVRLKLEHLSDLCRAGLLMNRTNGNGNGE